MKNLFICAALLMIIHSGCSSDPLSGQKAELKTVIAKYNTALIEAYKNKNFDYLAQVATEDEIKKIGIVINSYRQAGQIMESELHRIDFGEIKTQGDKADVRTSEDWSYRWVDYKTGAEAEPRKSIHYEILYRMVKKDGKWLVEKIEEVK